MFLFRNYPGHLNPRDAAKALKELEPIVEQLKKRAAKMQRPV